MPLALSPLKPTVNETISIRADTQLAQLESMSEHSPTTSELLLQNQNGIWMTQLILATPGEYRLSAGNESVIFKVSPNTGLDWQSELGLTSLGILLIGAFLWKLTLKKSFPNAAP